MMLHDLWLARINNFRRTGVREAEEKRQSGIHEMHASVSEYARENEQVYRKKKDERGQNAWPTAVDSALLLINFEQLIFSFSSNNNILFNLGFGAFALFLERTLLPLSSFPNRLMLTIYYNF